MEVFDELEEAARQAASNPQWNEWVDSRRELEHECRRQRPKREGEALSDCSQTRLATLKMFTDDPAAIVIGVERATRLL